MDIGLGDEVIIPTFTIISCALAIIRAGALPVLVDSDPATWNMAVDQISDKITPNTKAIMAVHIYGLPVDMNPLIELCQKHGLLLIEDAAEAIGLEYRNRPCGSFGDISAFSFYANKHVTMGEGGFVAVNDPSLAETCSSLRNLCFKNPRFVHDRLGWNMRITNIQAAIGLAQLERLDLLIKKKRRMGRRYTDLLSNVSEIQLPLTKTDYADNVYWVYGILLDDSLEFDGEEVMARLHKRGIGTRPFFWPMHEQPILETKGLFADESYPVAEKIARRGFYLPSGVTLSDDQMDYVVENLIQVLAG